jgi:hypothetical protein
LLVELELIVFTGGAGFGGNFTGLFSFAMISVMALSS